MVVYVAMDQMVGGRRSPRATILGGRDCLPLPPTIAARSRRLGCVHSDALWCGQCTRWLVLYFLKGSDVAASMVLTVAAAAIRVGPYGAASLMPAVAAAAVEG